MAQAASKDTTIASRRSLLSGMAVLPAVSLVPGVAAGAAVGAECPAPDARLIALGAKLDAMLPDIWAKLAAAKASCDAAGKEARRRYELSCKELRKEQSDFWETWKAVRREFGSDELIGEGDKAMAPACKIHEEIIAAPAHTLAGMAVKARAAATFALSHLWDEPEVDLDWDKSVMRRLIEDICGAAGVSLVDLGAAA